MLGSPRRLLQEIAAAGLMVPALGQSVLGQAGSAAAQLVATPAALIRGTRTALEFLPRVDALISELADTVARISTLVAEVEPVPARVGTVIRKVERLVDRVGPVLVRVDTAVTGAEGVLAQVGAITDEVTPVARRVSELMDELEPVLQGLASLEPAVVERLTVLIEDAGLLLAGARALGGDLVDDATSTLQRLPSLLDDVEGRVLPSVASLEGLVPVVAQLGVHVVSLNEVVADVGALLAGIPGSARLLKRGERPRPAAADR